MALLQNITRFSINIAQPCQTIDAQMIQPYIYALFKLLYALQKKKTNKISFGFAKSITHVI
jgi:hypothetical protein